jgi:hypothetical protein
VVLRSDVALSGDHACAGNIVTTVTELHLGGLGADGAGNQLVTETNAEDGYPGILEHLGEVVDSDCQSRRVTGTVGHEQTVVVLSSKGGEVIVPRDNHDLHTASKQATQLVVLHTNIQAKNTHSTAGGMLEGDVRGWCEEAGLAD